MGYKLQIQKGRVCIFPEALITVKRSAEEDTSDARGRKTAPYCTAAPAEPRAGPEGMSPCMPVTLGLHHVELSLNFGKLLEMIPHWYKKL